jgi:hypothetical protein
VVAVAYRAIGRAVSCVTDISHIGGVDFDHRGRARSQRARANKAKSGFREVND